MNHEFKPSPISESHCEICKRSLDKHQSCDACNYIGTELEYRYLSGTGNAWLCPVCLKQEDDYRKLRASLSTQNDPTKVIPPTVIQPTIQEIVQTAPEVIDQPELKTDLFNIEVAEILKIRAAIFTSDAENKPYVFAQAILERIKHSRQLVFDLENSISEARKRQTDENGRQKALHQALVDYEKQLTAEEREKIKTADINYKPSAPKQVKPKVSKPTKFSKAEIKKVASECGLTAFFLETFMIAKNLTPYEAAELIKKQKDTVK